MSSPSDPTATLKTQTDKLGRTVISARQFTLHYELQRDSLTADSGLQAPVVMPSLCFCCGADGPTGTLPEQFNGDHDFQPLQVPYCDVCLSHIGTRLADRKFSPREIMLVFGLFFLGMALVMALNLFDAPDLVTWIAWPLLLSPFVTYPVLWLRHAGDRPGPVLPRTADCTVPMLHPKWTGSMVLKKVHADVVVTLVNAKVVDAFRQANAANLKSESEVLVAIKPSPRGDVLIDDIILDPE
jgi:hypothetical protein